MIRSSGWPRRPFLKEYPKLLAAVRQTLAAGDAPALRTAAHSLKGSLRYFGETPRAALAFHLETMGSLGKLAEAAANIEALDPPFCAVAPDIQRRLQQPAPAALETCNG